MDREDAALVVRALKCRIEGAQDQLEELAASSLMQLSAIAGVIARRNTENWPPAAAAVAELMAICRRGGKIVDDPLEADLQPFIDLMEKLVAELPPPPNRAARRAQASRLPREQRIFVDRPKLIGFGRQGI